MDNNRVVTFVETSFLSELIKDEEVTDISFNGNSIFYLHNYRGRQKSNIQISVSDAKDFIRQIANLTEKQFSYQVPILDVTSGKYRLNAVHNSIGRYLDEQVITFSIRIASIKPRITDDSGFLTPELISLIKAIIKSSLSIVIGGTTGSGKTEFQKYLLSKMEDSTRVIIIDNVLELSQLALDPRMDVNLWQSDEKNESTCIQNLVKNALRNNPDWLVIAESRGGEMLEIMNSVMTGHPAITTIHASDANSMPNRIARMVMMNDKRSDYQEVLRDVSDNFPIHFYLKRKIDVSNNVVRYIESITIIEKNGKSRTLYENKNDKHIYHQIPKSMLTFFEGVDDEMFIRNFGGGSYENL